MKAAVSAPTSVNFWHTTQRYHEEYGSVHTYGHDSLYRYNVIVDRPLNMDGGQKWWCGKRCTSHIVCTWSEGNYHPPSVSKLSLSLFPLSTSETSLHSLTHTALTCIPSLQVHGRVKWKFGKLCNRTVMVGLVSISLSWLPSLLCKMSVGPVLN
jgi:hypothetical protein